VKQTTLLFICLLIVAITAGTLADRVPDHEPVFAGGYRVVAVDLHMHSSFGSDGLLSPLGLILEARHQGLDAIALTDHNEIFTAGLERWIARELGIMSVLTGEEIYAPKYHLIAIGISKPVSFRQDAADAIDDIHWQGGVAIAAHPALEYAGFSNAAVAKLDGSEICHPTIYWRPQVQLEFERFAARGNMAPIGSSDYHGFGLLGSCRTFAFAHDNSEAAILDAIRNHRTVVFGGDDKIYGKPELVDLAKAAGVQRTLKSDGFSWLDSLSCLAGIVGITGIVLSDLRKLSI
jgi:predicted metal-dependent phosphoesterase TrpH